MRLSKLAIFSRLAISILADYAAASTSCTELASALPGLVFSPETPTYNASITSYPFIQLRLHPNCILRPKTAHDVSVALSVLKESNNTRFAVKGGGHNANAGFNNVDDGVTIDMQSMKSAEIAQGDQVLRIGAGALSQDAYDAAEKKNLTVLAGRIGVVGLGGFLTGGGVSFFSPQYGWSCDNVINFEVVLASGEIVNANATSNSDLYAALKGGQNNFGIVTRFDMKAYPTTKLWGGRIVYAPNATESLLTAFTNFKMAATPDPYIAGWVTVRYNHSAALFNPVAIMWYTKPEQKPGGLKEIVEVKPQLTNGFVEAPISEHTRNASRQVVAAPRRTIWATTTFHVSSSIVHKVHFLWEHAITSICESYASANPSAELTFQAIPPPPAKGAAQNSFNISSSEKTSDLVFLQLVFYFDGAEAEEGLQRSLKNLLELVEERTKIDGVYHPFTYLNFASWFQDPIGSYGFDQKQMLKKVANKYDPTGVFQRQVSGGFKLL